MEEKKLELVILDRILRLVEMGKSKPAKHNWLVTFCIWVAVAVVSSFVTNRLRGTGGGRALIVAGAFFAGIIVTYAVFNAWQLSMWSHAARYLDAEAIRKRIAELR